MGKLGLKNKIIALNSLLFVIIGMIIVIRSIGLHAWLPVIVGASFIGYGIYRTVYILKYLRSRQ